METNSNLKKIKYNFDNNGFIILRNFLVRKKLFLLKKIFFSFLNQKNQDLKKRNTFCKKFKDNKFYSPLKMAVYKKDKKK